MKHWSLAASTAAIALFAGTAQADVTAGQVWQNWQDMAKAYGQTMTVGGTRTEGSTLIVSDVKSVTDKDDTHVESAIAEVRLTDKGDGTVEITMSDSYVVTMDLPKTDGEEGRNSAGLSFTQPGLVVTASGTPEATDYAFSAPSMEIALTSVDGKPAAEQGIAAASATISNLTGHYLLAGAEGAKTIESHFAADSLALAVKAKNADSGEDVSVTASVLAPVMKMTGNLTGLESTELSDALKAGFATDMSLDYGAVSYDVSVVDGRGPTSITGSSEGGSLQVAMDAARLLLATQGRGVKLAMSGPDIPLPQLSLSYAESGFTFLMPVAKSDTPQDFAFLTKFVDLSVSDDLWGMIDPTGQLPHDPATLVIDTEGKATLTTDIMNEAEMAALGDGAPGELNALDITEVHARIAGAELTGSGGFTFDNSDTETYGGMPAPTGKLDLRLTGGNTLMDKLVTMGLLTQDDVMGARMMLSMFANQAGEDELTSTLEFKDKHFFANGQQLQ
jgi:hypothetical protein